MYHIERDRERERVIAVVLANNHGNCNSKKDE